MREMIMNLEEYDILRNEWITAIKGIDPKIAKLDLKSPVFEFGRWRLAAEHQRNFRSVVFQWIGDEKESPILPDEWHTRPADAKKGWTHRVKLSPAELPEFLGKLSIYEKARLNERTGISGTLQKLASAYKKIRLSKQDWT